MGRKIYSPVQIRNPVSLQHLALIHSGQSLELTLDHEIFPGEKKVELSTEHLIISDMKKLERHDKYFIDHDFQVLDWSTFSQALIGEIWIDAENCLSKVLVVMDTCNDIKRRHMCVVNPDCCDMRIKPYNIFEVVLYDADFTSHDEWTWEWTPYQNHDPVIDIEEIGCDFMNVYAASKFNASYSDTPSSLYAKHSRVARDKECKPWQRQHHFWFRFDRSIIEGIENFNDIRAVGSLSFTGYANRYQKHLAKSTEFKMTVYVDFRGDTLKKTQETLLVPKLTEATRSTTVSFGEKSEATSGIVHLKPSRKVKLFPNVSKVSLPMKKEVVITKVPFNSLEDGCKVMSCSPQMANIPEDDKWDDIDCYPPYLSRRGYGYYNSYFD